MKKVLFVDHAFHSRTRSSQFFIDLLATQFKVEVLSVDSEHRGPINFTVPDDVDIALVWQMDYLAPVFLSKGLPTVIVPMYDGSAAMPPMHWHMLREARFLAFSFQLNWQLQEAGCASMLVKYFPEVPRQQVADFSELKGFLWQRNSSDISWGLVNHIIGSQISSLHVHDAPDDSSTFRLPFQKMNYPITVTSWCEDGHDLEGVLNSCNVYIAPRSSEGIGMAFLEAMARGCCVLAHNLPTHNEYIAHGVNGLLFDRERGDRLDLSDAQSLGAWARRTIVEGRKQWLDVHCPRILDYIDAAEAPSDDVRRYSGTFLEDLVDSYVRGVDWYTAFLKRNAALVYGQSHGAAQTHHLNAPAGTQPVRFGRGAAGAEYQVTGFEDDAGVSWCCSQTAELIVPVNEREPAVLAFDAVAADDIPAEIRVDVYVNGQRMVRSSFSPATRKARLYCVVPVEHRRTDMLHIKFITDKLYVGSSCHEKASGVGLTEFQVFSFDEIPIKAVHEMEQIATGFLSEKNVVRKFVMWCLESGKSLYKGTAAVEFSSENVVTVARSLVHDARSGAADPELASVIWNSREVVEHVVLGEVPLHALHKEVIELRDDVKRRYDVTTRTGLAGYLGWYYLHGVTEYKFDGLVNPAELEWLFAYCTGFPAQSPLLRFAYCVWAFRTDVQRLFDIETAEGRERMMEWFSTAGATEMPNVVKLAVMAKGIRRDARYHGITK